MPNIIWIYTSKIHDLLHDGKKIEGRIGEAETDSKKEGLYENFNNLHILMRFTKRGPTF
jgi:hypothetical protein